MSGHQNSHPRKPSCGCEHGHDESPLPQGVLVTTSGILTGAGLVLGWMDTGPAWLQTAIFAVATLAGGLLVFPAAWKALLARRLDMNVLMTVAVAGAWIIGDPVFAGTVNQEGSLTVRVIMRREIPPARASSSSSARRRNKSHRPSVGWIASPLSIHLRFSWPRFSSPSSPRC